MWHHTYMLEPGWNPPSMNNKKQHSLNSSQHVWAVQKQSPRKKQERSLRAQLLSHVQLFPIPWTVACQAPLSMGFSRQEYWNGLPLPPPGDLPDPGIKRSSPVSPALAGRFFTTAPPGKPKYLTAFPNCSLWKTAGAAGLEQESFYYRKS